jgi:hypothetical protein
MRIILSHGKVNIFNLAKNAGTSVEQIERFYAKHLPLSREMAKNLQSLTDVYLYVVGLAPWGIDSTNEWIASRVSTQP